TEPRYSPDGQRIAFVSDAGGNEQLWIMASDGSDAEQFTNESRARVTDPVWDPAGPWLIGRRRTIDTRSIGVTELWQYHLDGGAGFALTSKDELPHAGEVTTDGHRIWFSSRSGRFSYDEDPLKGLWKIIRFDRKTGHSRMEVGGNGSAVRPLLMADGSGLIFVSRDRNKTLLEHLDFETRQRRVIADWLDHDQMEGFALHGVYPAMDWTDNGDIVLWAEGKLWRLTMEGERTEIRFHVKAEWTFHDVPRWQSSPPNVVKAKLNRWASLNAFGDLAYSAMGRVIVENKRGKMRDLGGGFAPRWSADGTQLVWTSWSDKANTGGLHITNNRGMGSRQTLPVKGQLVNPVFSPDGNTIVVLRDPNLDNQPNLGSIPWYEFIVLSRRGRSWIPTVIETSWADTGIGFRAPRLTIHDGRIWWLAVGETPDREPAKSDFVSMKLDGTDNQTHLTFPGAIEAAPSPDFTRIAYKLNHQAWVTAMPQPGTHTDTESLPKAQLTDIVGDWLSWTPDGNSVTWVHGAELHTRTLDGPGIPRPSDDDGDDGDDGDDQIEAPTSTRSLRYSRDRAVPSGQVAITHATVLPMDGNESIEDATIVIDGDTIVSVTAGGAVPKGAKILDATGKTAIPGLIDVHAHLHYSSADIVPNSPWQYGVNLDFGVTTVHDPSASTDLVFTQAERVSAGLSPGPRVYSTGYILYGALGNENAETPDEKSAHRHVKRLKTVGAKSVKVYQQSRRDERQWYVDACNTHEILCVAEGGGDLWMNLSMVADGFHAVEHALPNAPLYSDVQQFMAGSPTENSAGTAYSPTLLVAYGGLSGELYFYQHDGAYDDARLLKNWDRRDLDAKTRRGGLSAQADDWNHQEVARAAAKMARNGVLVTMGAHGQLQGLGAHWELWGLAGPGAMTPVEALKAATIDGARYLGMEDVLGSITPGKLADLIILNADPREDIRNTTDIEWVLKNGEVVTEP
ncbi:MAG: amidohydrolase family protein, partial [Deltaproteobacteria bacterium]|nr:amidohydrolase family protein [Deltaproteobacteria bacterium]